LRRELGPWSAAAIVVGTVIGSGIFLVPRDMIRAVGSPEMVFVVWVFGGVLTLFGALTYAELSAALPEAGGEYVYLNTAYGRFWGFIYGWTQMWVAKPASIATLATAFFYYLANFAPGLDAVLYSIPLPIGPGGQALEIRYGQILGMSVILLLAAVNYAGVKVGGNVQVAVTLVKVALILGLIGFGLFYSGVPASPSSAPSVPASSGGFSGFFAALVAALWAYDGWNNAGMVGSEIRRPERNLPVALIFGTLAVIVLYLMTNFAYFHVLSGPEVANSDRVAAEMMRRIMGQPGAAVVSVAAMISIFAALNGSILTGSRVPYAMARDGLFFRPVARVHPQYHTPGVSILLMSGWAALMVLSGRYDDLYNVVIFASWILYGMTAASVIVLRKRRPDLKRPYKVLGYPVVPILFVFVTTLLLFSTLQRRPRESLIGLGLILVGFPFYFHWKKRAHSA
jgi:amino acid transporter